MNASGLLVVNGEIVTHDALFAAATRVASWLASLGVGSGDRLVLALETSLDHLVLVIASWRLDVALVSVPPTMSRASFEGLVQTLAPAAVAIDRRNDRLTGAAISGDAISFANRAESDLVFVACTPRAPRPIPDRSSDWTSWLTSAPEAVFYTSGSTATAKGVRLAWPAILQKGVDVVGFYDAVAGDRLMPALPMSHVYALYLVLGALGRGIDCVLLRESASPAAFAECIENVAVTLLVCPPQLGGFLFARRRPDPALIRTLRVLSMGGAATTPALAEALVANLPHVRVVLSYGLAETYSTVCCNDLSEADSDATSVGPLRFGAYGEVRNPETGLGVSRGTAGELCVGGTITPGYLGLDERRTDFFTSDGLFRTGDLVVIDDRDHVHIVGRLKEIINAGGLSIYPSEVEESLKAHPDVLDCGVFADRSGDLELVCAAIVFRARDGATPEALIDSVFDFCRTHLASKMIPRRIVSVAAIPRGGLGKVARAELKALCAAHGESP